MATIRCPMCGKENPEELEECQFCQARLKPLIVSPPDESDNHSSRSSSNQPAPGGPALPDWLNALRQPEESTSEEEDNLPDWLSSDDEQDLAAGDSDWSFPEDNPEQVRGKASENEAEVPDWLSDLRQNAPEGSGRREQGGDIKPEDAASPRPSSIRSEDEGAFPDWLANMRTGAGSPQEEEPEPGEEEFEEEQQGQGEADEQEPEWLKRIRSHQHEAEKDQEGLVSSQADTGDEGQPDKSQPEEGGTFASAEDSLPSWLTDAGASDQEDEQAAAPSETEGLPHWPAEEAEPEIVPSPDEEGYPESRVPQDELPGWLSHLEDVDQLSGEDQPSAGEGEEAIEPGELPDWLLETNKEHAQESQTDETSLPEEQEQGDLGAPEQPASFEEELPDWVGNPDAEETEEDAGLPAWLQEETDQAEETGAAGAAGAQSFSIPEEEQRSTGEEPSEEGIPDWMGLLESTGAESETPAEPDEPAEGEEAGSEELSWLEDLEATSPQFDMEEKTPPGSVAPFTLDEEGDLEPGLEGGDLPDWLKEAGLPPEQPSGEAEVEEPADQARSEPGLEPAELPSWLKAMRPLDTTAGQPEDEANKAEVEKGGPLAGLSGLLPAEPEVSQTQKPPAYFIKLQATDAQKAKAGMFEQLIKQEAEPKPLPPQPVILPQHILRIGIGLILIASILWPLIMGTPAASLPTFGAGTGAASQAINHLPPNAPVLLAFDYQPGWSGELDATSAAVLDHLMLKGAYLTLVSTTATGPAQAERLLAAVNQRGNHTYRPGRQYTNLGFLPGGQAGLLSFVQSPRQVLPIDLNGGPGWDSTNLQAVKSLSDFAMTIVITENPQVARSWIEQVQPSLNGKPLLMLVSAQAEPLVRPYFEGSANQVQGMVTGLSGGAAYEKLTGRPIIASNYWNAYSTSLIVAVILILIGGLYNAAVGIFSGKKTATKGGRVAR